MKRLIVFYLLAVLAIPEEAKGQDHHFSQFDATLQYLNPALTGMNTGTDFLWRANTAYRSQWRGISTKPFNNVLLGYDMPFKGFGIGGYALNNRAGAAFLNTFNFIIGGAYEITIDPKNEHNLFGGLQIGLFHRSIRTDNLLFDSQYSYSTQSYDATIDNGENFGNRSIARFDANLGFYYKLRKNNLKVSPHAGFSLFHITMPNESFTSEKNRLPIRWVFTGGCEYVINESVVVQPNFLTMFQAKASDIVFSTLVYYKIRNTDFQTVSGLAYRFKDAVILHLGLKHGPCTYRISYDINTSYLKNYTQGRGGLELSVIYIKAGSRLKDRTLIN